MTLNLESNPDFYNVVENAIKSRKKYNPRFICDICGQPYRHKQSLEIHLGIHNGTSTFTCDYCGKLFTQKISLKRHIPIHTQITQYTVKIILFSLYTYCNSCFLQLV